MPHATRVCVAGAGPAGLVLAIALGRAGIDCTVVERRDRAAVEGRARAGFLEQRTVEYLRGQGLTRRMDGTAMRHTRCEFRLPGQRFSLPYGELAGGYAHTVYPQQLLVADLVDTLLAEGGTVLFGHPVDGITGLDGARPRVTCRPSAGAPVRIECDLVAGCDGWRGAARAALPPGAVRVTTKRYPFNWLTLLAEVPAGTDQVVYAVHGNGFAGQMPRTPRVSRFYLQCPAGSTVEQWPDGRVRKELAERMGAPAPPVGRVLDKGMLAMRAAVTEPMAYRRLLLAGDSAHPLTPVGAKGMNLAIADAAHLARAIAAYYRGDGGPLRGYGAGRLPDVRAAHDFSERLLHMLHPPTPAASGLARLARDEELARAFSRDYVGAP